MSQYNDPCRRRPAEPEYLFGVSGTGDSPVPSGDPPDEMANAVGWETCLLIGDARTPVPCGESPDGAGGSPALPKLNRYEPQAPQCEYERIEA